MFAMYISLVVICCTLVSRVSPQNSSTIETLRDATPCPNSFLDANATGSVSFGFPNQDGNFTWVYSVSESTNNDTLGSLWLGSQTTVNLSFALNGSSLCIIQLGLIQNTIERGQTDAGFCEQALDPTCVLNLETAAANEAGTILSSLLSVPLMSAVCAQVGSSIVEATGVKDCAQYFYPNFHVNTPFSFLESTSTEFTGEGSCINEAYPNMTFTNFRNIQEDFTPGLDGDPYYLYDAAYRNVTALLTLLMPPSNLESFSTYNQFQPELNCIRITKTSSGSRVAPTFPTPPYSTTGRAEDAPYLFIGLGGVSIIAWPLILFLRRKRRARQAALLSGNKKTKDNAIMIDGHAVFEAAVDGGRSGRAELKDQAIGEMQGTDVQNMLHGDDQPVEIA